MIDFNQLNKEIKTIKKENNNTFDQFAQGKKRMRLMLFALLMLCAVIIMGDLFLESMSAKKREKEIADNNYKIDAQYSQITHIWDANTKINNDCNNKYFFIENNILYANICSDIYAFDIKNGDKLWEKIGERLSLVEVKTFSDSKNDIIFGGDYDYLYALNPKNGEIIWKTEDTSWRIELYSTDKVVLSTSRKNFLRAIDNSNGKELWKTDTKSETIGVTYNEGLFFITSNYGFIMAINELTGKIVWTSKAGERTNINTSQKPVFFRDNEGAKKIFLTNYNSFALDVTNGKELSKKLGIGYEWFEPIILGNNLFAGSGGNFCALNTKNLEEKWCVATPGGYLSGPILKDNTIYFSNWCKTVISDVTYDIKDRNIFAINIEDGKQIWKYSSENLSSDLMVNNNFVATTHDDFIHILDRKTGVEKKKFPLVTFIMDNENIYTLSPNGIINAIPLITN